MSITRRTFLGSSALALAGMAATGKVEASLYRRKTRAARNAPPWFRPAMGFAGWPEPMTS